MSQHEQSRPMTAGVWEPAFPPVVLAEEEDHLTRYVVRPGLTKLEMATILFAAVATGSPQDFEQDEDDQPRVAWAAYQAELALNAAAARQSIAAAVEQRAHQLGTGTPPAWPAPTSAPADVSGAVDRLAEVMQFLSDTHQLAGFRAWRAEQAENDVYDPAEAERMMRGAVGSDTTKGG